MQARLRETLAAHMEVIRGLEPLLPEVERLAAWGTQCLRAGGRILWMGNGGSAADCQHLAAELVGRFERDRPGLASIALTTDTSILTSVGNDLGFERIFARQVEALGRPGDLLIGLSTSGKSRNVLAALEVGRGLGLRCAGLSGGSGGRPGCGDRAVPDGPLRQYRPHPGGPHPHRAHGLRSGGDGPDRRADRPLTAARPRSPSMFQSLQSVVEALRGGLDRRRVLVVGDVMLDRYLWGRVSRISPEAPVPVLHLERETDVAGGAANVARNLAGLGVQVALAGVTGDDPARAVLLGLLAADGIDTADLAVAADRGTVTKTRVIGNHQQMIRIDAERAEPLTALDRERLIAAVTARLPGLDALLLSDYAKGVLGPETCTALIAAARANRVPVLVDPKGRDFTRYAGRDPHYPQPR